MECQIFLTSNDKNDIFRKIIFMAITIKPYFQISCLNLFQHLWRFAADRISRNAVGLGVFGLAMLKGGGWSQACKE
jgi:hypothetical protein